MNMYLGCLLAMMAPHHQNHQRRPSRNCPSFFMDCHIGPTHIVTHIVPAQSYTITYQWSWSLWVLVHYPSCRMNFQATVLELEEGLQEASYTLHVALLLWHLNPIFTVSSWEHRADKTHLSHRVDRQRVERWVFSGTQRAISQLNSVFPYSSPPLVGLRSGGQTVKFTYVGHTWKGQQNFSSSPDLEISQAPSHYPFPTLPSYLPLRKLNCGKEIASHRWNPQTCYIWGVQRKLRLTFSPWNPVPDSCSFPLGPYCPPEEWASLRPRADAESPSEGPDKSFEKSPLLRLL